MCYLLSVHLTEPISHRTGGVGHQDGAQGSDTFLLHSPPSSFPSPGEAAICPHTAPQGPLRPHPSKPHMALNPRAASGIPGFNTVRAGA